MNVSIPDDFNPFGFRCDNCGVVYVFTMEEIEQKKQKASNSEDYFILCDSCKKGHMQPPEMVVSINPNE